MCVYVYMYIVHCACVYTHISYMSVRRTVHCACMHIYVLIIDRVYWSHGVYIYLREFNL